MPLTINVGLSRKASRDFQSTGTSINVTAELDGALLAKPDELQARIADLYAEAGRALERQTSAAPPARRVPVTHPNGDGNGHAHPPPQRQAPHRRRPVGPMTASQRQALERICGRLGENPHDASIGEIGVPFEDLSVREASSLIDRLKARADGNGQARHQYSNGAHPR